MTFVRPSGGWIARPTVGNGLCQFTLSVVRPVMSYAVLDLGADAWWIGVLTAVFAVVPMCAALPLGVALGRVAHIALIPFLSALSMIVGCVIAATMSDLVALVLASACLGLGSIGVTLGIQAWISRSAPSRLYHSGFGWMAAAGSLGQGVGPVVAGLVIGPAAVSAAGISAACWIAAASAAGIAIVFATRVTRQYPKDVPARVSSWNVARTPGVFRYTVISAAVLTSVDILTVYLPLIGERHGISPVVIGVLLGVRGAASMLSRLLLGPLSHRLSTSQLILLSVAGSGIALLAVAFSTTPVPLAAAMLLSGFFLGIGQPVTASAVAALLAPQARSQGLALRMLGNYMGASVVPLVGAGLAVLFGPAAVYIAQAGGLGLASIWEARSRNIAPGDRREPRAG